MERDRLLPYFASVRVARVEAHADGIRVEARSQAAVAVCPACPQRSRRLHGSSTRHLADLPIGQRAVMMQLQGRRCRCQNTNWSRRTFGERTPTLVAPHARRSVPLQALLGDRGLTRGGRPGARFAQRQVIATSRLTLLRRVRALRQSPHAWCGTGRARKSAISQRQSLRPMAMAGVTRSKRRPCASGTARGRRRAGWGRSQF